MLRAISIADRYGDFICRRCINKKYGVKLEPKDCRYGYPHVCRVCKKTHNIVVGFSVKGHLKMLFK